MTSSIINFKQENKKYTLFTNKFNFSDIIEIAKTKYYINLLLQNVGKFYDLRQY